MGYVRIVQYGNKTELYEYAKNLGDNKRKRILTPLQKKRAKERRIATSSLPRRKDSIARAKRNFFRLVHHNNTYANSIHFATFTYAVDISYYEATKAIARFFRELKSEYPSTISVSYISVPEKTKRGRFHFHLLIYDLPPELSKRERETRNLQRLFQRGYLDISPTTYVTEGLAGYMAKYMAKALGSSDNEAVHGYTSSRNIKKPTSAGSNTLNTYTDIILPDVIPSLSTEYDVPFLGKCKRTVYTVLEVESKVTKFTNKNRK